MANRLAATFATKVDVVNSLDVSTNRLAGYDIGIHLPPSSITLPLTRQYSSDNTTGPGGALRGFQRSDVTVASTPYVIDLTAAICTDGTVGVTHFRELVIVNLDLVNPLTLLGGSNSIATLFMGSATTITVPPGGHFVVPPKPLGTNGYLVDSTHKNLQIDPGGAFTTAFQVILLGD